MSKTDHTADRHTDDEPAAREDETASRDESAETHDHDRAARLETIRQMALAGELEVAPEAEEIVDALLDTIRQRDEHYRRFQEMAAEHQNYQRRASINEREARTSATQGVVQALIPMIDHFDMAITQDPDKVSAAQVIDGVRLIRDGFLRMLSSYGVTPIDPQVGDEFNPGEHAAMLQQHAEGVAPGHISAAMGMGYKLGDRVVRPAKVAVAPSAESGGSGAAADPKSEGADDDKGGDA